MYETSDASKTYLTSKRALGYWNNRGPSQTLTWWKNSCTPQRNPSNGNHRFCWIASISCCVFLDGAWISGIAVTIDSFVNYKLFDLSKAFFLTTHVTLNRWIADLKEILGAGFIGRDWAVAQDSPKERVLKVSAGESRVGRRHSGKLYGSGESLGRTEAEKHLWGKRMYGVLLNKCIW